MGQIISNTLTVFFCLTLIYFSWRNEVARHIVLASVWSELCIIISHNYYPQNMSLTVHLILVVWSLIVIFLYWILKKVFAKDNKVILYMFLCLSLCFLSHCLNKVQDLPVLSCNSVPKFYQLGILMTSFSYLILAFVSIINRIAFQNRFYISGFTVAAAFLVGNTIHLMTEWTALVFFYRNILYVISFFLFLLGILGFFLVYRRNVSFVSFISAYGLGFVMGYYGYSMVSVLQKALS